MTTTEQKEKKSLTAEQRRAIKRNFFKWRLSGAIGALSTGFVSDILTPEEKLALDRAYVLAREVLDKYHDRNPELGFKKTKIIFNVEKTTTGFSAYCSTAPAFTTGEDILKLKANALESINLYRMSKRLLVVTMDELHFKMKRAK